MSKKKYLQEIIKENSDNLPNGELTLEQLKQYLWDIFKKRKPEFIFPVWDIISNDNYFAAELKSGTTKIVTGSLGFTEYYKGGDVVFNGIKLTPEQITKLIEFLKKEYQ